MQKLSTADEEVKKMNAKLLQAEFDKEKVLSMSRDWLY